MKILACSFLVLFACAAPSDASGQDRRQVSKALSSDVPSDVQLNWVTRLDGANQVALADGSIWPPVVGARASLGVDPRFPELAPDVAVWPWASLTKLVTAVLVLQEVEAGRLSLDDRLGAHLAYLQGEVADTSVEAALRHRTGLANPDSLVTEADAGRFYRATASDFQFCSEEGEVATDFSYNNCDYVLLGALLQQVTGRPFETLVTDRIARPLSLRSLRMAGSDDVLFGATDGSFGKGGFRVESLGASGGLVGSVTDAAAFVAALGGDGLLGADARSMLFEGDPESGYHGMGVWAYDAVLPSCGGPRLLAERRGEIPGVKVLTLLDRQSGRALAAFSRRPETDWGWIWQGKGLSFEMASAAFCPDTTSNVL